MVADHQAPTDPIHVARIARQAGPELPTVGPFRSIRLLAEAGMGVVYLAEQTSPLRRQVALKLIRKGFDSREMVARFERERQALARMSHPHIAQVYDAGTCPDGRPYFAMEYVAGVSITQFCDEHRLDIRRRLELFGVVCDAIEHAHDKGLIHRDIKPSNVLVSGTAEDACPKVIDFGIAKGIDDSVFDDTFSTLTGQFVGTPAYMSPEQASMGEVEVDHRTDVYSLGVLLYELLVGVLPFQLGGHGRPSLAEVQRIIREQDPIAPSTRFAGMGAAAATIATQRGTDTLHLRRALRREIDWLLLKCLEKQPQRRYATAGALAEDVRRYLRHEPMIVGPPTWGYRARKFVRRNRRGVIAASISICVLGPLLFAGMSYRAAESVRRERSLEAIRYKLNEAQWLAYSKPTVSATKLQELVAEDPTMVEAWVQLAYLYLREARINESLAAANEVLKLAPDNGPAHLVLAEIYRRRDPPASERHRQAASAFLNSDFYEALSLPRSESSRAIEILTGILNNDGMNFDARLNRALRYFQQRDYAAALADADHLVENRHDSPIALNVQGNALTRLERFAEAVESFTKALRIVPDHAPTYLNRADAYLAQKHARTALMDCNQAIKLEPDFADAYVQRAVTLLQLRQPDEAAADCAAALAISPENPLAYYCRARVHLAAQKHEAALSDLERAIQLDKTTAEFHYLRGFALQLLKRYEDAYVGFSEALNLDATDADAWQRRGTCAGQLGALDAALADYSRAINLEPKEPGAYHNRARVYRSMGSWPEALADHDNAVAFSDPADSRAHIGRGVTHWRLGDLGGAIADFQTAADRDRDGEVRVPCMLWIWQIQNAAGRKDLAEAALAHAEASARDFWQLEIISLLRGFITPDRLLEVAGADASRQIDAAYYIGARAEAAGRRANALLWYEQLMENGENSGVEFELAVGHIARLQAHAEQERLTDS